MAISFSRNEWDSQQKVLTLGRCHAQPGGEYRKSYHGYPHGYGQFLHSPTYFVCEPMQIDTHNRTLSRRVPPPRSAVYRTSSDVRLAPQASTTQLR